MKLKSAIGAALAILIPTMVVAGKKTSEVDVRNAYERWVEAVDSRDLVRVESLAHSGFRAVFTLGAAGEPTLLDRTAYLGGMKAGKIGGHPRTLSVRSMKVYGHLAALDVKLVGEKATFTGTVTLAKSDGAWRVVQDATVYQPR